MGKVEGENPATAMRTEPFKIIKVEANEELARVGT
jgi:hypothetical protein